MYYSAEKIQSQLYAFSLLLGYIYYNRFEIAVNNILGETYEIKKIH